MLDRRVRPHLGVRRRARRPDPRQGPRAHRAVDVLVRADRRTSRPTTSCRPTPPTSPRPRGPTSPGRAMLVRAAQPGAARVRRPRLPVRLGVVRLPGDGAPSRARRSPPACARPSGCPSRSSRPPRRPRPATTCRSPTPMPPSWSATSCSSSCATSRLRVYAFGAALRGAARADPRRHQARVRRDRRRAPRHRRDAHARLVALLAAPTTTRSAPRRRRSTSSTCATTTSSIGWDQHPPAPRLPSAVIEGTRARYVEAYELVTGRSFDEWHQPEGPSPDEDRRYD